MLLRRVRGFGGYGLEDRCGFGGCFRAGWVLGMGVLVPRELSSGWKGGFGRMVEEEGAAPERRKGGFYDGEEGAGSHERRNRRYPARSREVLILNLGLRLCSVHHVGSRPRKGELADGAAHPRPRDVFQGLVVLPAAIGPREGFHNLGFHAAHCDRS